MMKVAFKCEPHQISDSTWYIQVEVDLAKLYHTPFKHLPVFKILVGDQQSVAKLATFLLDTGLNKTPPTVSIIDMKLTSKLMKEKLILQFK